MDMSASLLLLLAGVPMAAFADAPVWTTREPSSGSARGGCLQLKMTGPAFVAGSYSCLFKRGTQRASAPAVATTGPAGNDSVTCIVPSWEFEQGLVQLILVREGYGPIKFGGDNPSDEMFQYLPEWQFLSSNPSHGPASGGTTLGFRTYGFLAGYKWYRCFFTRNKPDSSSNAILVQNMTAPADANGTHVHCTTPPWGSLYAASLQAPYSQVSVLLHDYDTEISSSSDVSNYTSVPAQSSCNQQNQHPSIFSFRPVLTTAQVMGTSAMSVFVEKSCTKIDCVRIRF